MGVTAIELAEGQPPYANMHPMRALFKIPRYVVLMDHYPILGVKDVVILVCGFYPRCTYTKMTLQSKAFFS